MTLLFLTFLKLPEACCLVVDFCSNLCYSILIYREGITMSELKLYRKRIIPDECILLEDDQILYHNQEVIITKWNTIRPKKTLCRGYSCYFMERGFKVSKFYDHDDNLISWYCDIIDYSFDKATDTYVFTDLLVDVIVYPDGFVRVVDLNELADAARDGLLSPDQMQLALRRTDKLLSLIYKGAFAKLQKYIEDYEYNSD